jgi:hypothetical protein
LLCPSDLYGDLYPIRFNKFCYRFAHLAVWLFFRQGIKKGNKYVCPFPLYEIHYNVIFVMYTSKKVAHYGFSYAVTCLLFRQGEKQTVYALFRSSCLNDHCSIRGIKTCAYRILLSSAPLFLICNQPMSSFFRR